MHNLKNLSNNIKSLLLFAFPIILGNLGQMLIGAGDVFVAARHSTQTVAAISIASAITATIFIIGLGFLFSISPVLSKKRGQKEDIEKYLKTSLLYSIVLSVILGIISLIFVPIIPHLGFNKELIKNIQDFMLITSFSFAGSYIYQVFKEFLQAQERVFFANAISIVAIFLNIFLCWHFVFGNKYFPSLGVNGLAIASLIVRYFMGFSLLIYCRKFLKTKFTFQKSYLKEIYKVGYPIAFSLLLEFSAFNIIALIAGKISDVQVAVHNIVLTLASITFMIPLAVSNAIGVKIGYAYGSKSYKGIKDNLFAGLVISLFVMILCASMFFIVPEFLMKIFSSDKAIISTGASLLFIVAIFQIFDGIQVTFSGALRGLGFTKPILITIALGHWLIGIPSGIYLSFVKKLEIYGLWMGLAIALFNCSIIFSIFLFKKFKKIKLELLPVNEQINI